MMQVATHRSRGFTLIEILVVIVIVAISVGVVVVNFSGDSNAKAAKLEIMRLQQRLRFAHQQSVVRAEEYGVRFYHGGYRFLRFDQDNEDWIEPHSDKILKRYLLPEPLEVELYIEQVKTSIPESFDDDPEPRQTDSVLPSDELPDQQDKLRPHVFLLSSTEMTPAFELIIRVPGSDIEEQLNGLPQGEYRYVSED
jgi:general secretion pathway protein H